MSSEDRSLHSGLSLFFVYAISEGSSESVYMSQNRMSFHIPNIPKYHVTVHKELTCMHARIQKISPKGPDFLLVINIFHSGSYGPHSRNNWTQGAKLLLDGIRTRISKVTFNHS